MRLKISDTIAAEWDTRCIGDVIPALAGVDYSRGAVEVDEATAREIAADCRFYVDPRCVDATLGERSAYRALLRQVESAKK